MREPTPLPAPLTRAELSEYRETSRHADVIAFLDTLAPRARALMRVGSMGRSAEGREQPVVVLSRHRAFTPRAAKRAGLPVVMITANIHAGEVEGKEASLMLCRELTLGALRPLLDQLTVVLIPILNPDGNERISIANRRLDMGKLEGQLGPEDGAGTRNTGQGYNLNRDFMKLEAVETRNLSALFQAWWPHVYVDCHTTDGSIHGYDLTYDTAHNPRSGHPVVIDYARRELLPAVAAAVRKRHHRRGFFYGNHPDPDDPMTGWDTYPALPRFGSHYRGLTGRLDILLETYSYIDFKARVETIHAYLLEILRFVAGRGREVVAVVDAAERDVIAAGADPQPGDQVGIHYGIARRADGHKLEFDWPVYQDGEARIESWDLPSVRARRLPGKARKQYTVPHRCRFVPTRVVMRPWAYLVIATALGDKLAQHGVEFRELAEDHELEVEASVVLDAEKTTSPDICTGFERFETVFTTRTERRRVTVRPGALVVPTAQRLGNLVIYLLEPESDDGLARWELFDPFVKVGEVFPAYRLARPARLRTRRRGGSNPPDGRSPSRSPA